jgi:hypothetical protein
MMAGLGFLILLVIALESILLANAFSPFLGGGRVLNVGCNRPDSWALAASSNKRRRRRRKDPPTDAAVEPGSVEKAPAKTEAPLLIEDEASADEVDTDDILDVAKFKFIDETEEAPPQQEDSEAIPLPDIRQALQKKQIEEELALAQEEEEDQRVRIKRTDKEAMAKVSKVVYLFRPEMDAKYCRSRSSAVSLWNNNRTQMPILRILRWRNMVL